MEYLRYLDPSHTEMTSLPESVSTLYNLQTLILDHCSRLKALLTNLRNLSSLRHLNNSNVPALEEMPTELGRLTNLQTLQTFVVGKESGLGISEIGGLLQLRGPLHLSRLENVLDVQDAMKAKFVNKDGLDELVLEWSDKKDMKVDVLDSLRPHQNLQVLTITRYGGLKFPLWVGDPLFTNMVLVRLEGCNECQFLPPLGQLPSLKELFISGMSAVENVGIEFYGEGNLPFPLLDSLTFSVMLNWKEWSPCKRDQTKAFPCLKMLSISSCPKLEDINLKGCSNLKSLPDGLCHLTNLQRLWIRECGNLVSVARGGFPTSNLKEIVIGLCNKLEAVPKGMHNLVSLRSLIIFYSESFASSLEEGFPPNLISLHIHNLKSCKLLLEWWLHRLTSLRVLSDDGEDPDAVSFPLEKFPEMLLPNSLIELHISNLPNLMKLGAGIQLLTSLVRLDIWGCPKLPSMEKEGLPLSVTQLSVDGSPMLEERCKPGIKERYWPSIALIPFMHIGDWNNARSPSRLPMSTCFFSHTSNIFSENHLRQNSKNIYKEKEVLTLWLKVDLTLARSCCRKLEERLKALVVGRKSAEKRKTGRLEERFKLIRFHLRKHCSPATSCIQVCSKCLIFKVFTFADPLHVVLCLMIIHLLSQPTFNWTHEFVGLHHFERANDQGGNASSSSGSSSHI
ncbi:disease resistance protein RGA2-like [Pyrus communis]|uniref:disease resistance protein RGA2-like n=1 Tax=Pyrus communis TaxID=23211 RepID=UPI0035BFCF97